MDDVSAKEDNGNKTFLFLVSTMNLTFLFIVEEKHITDTKSVATGIDEEYRE